MRAVLEAATKIVKAMLLFIWTELTQMGVHSARLAEKEFIATGRFGSWLCKNDAEIALLKKVNEFSRPQADQKEENRKR